MLFLLGNIFPVLVMGLFASSVNNCRGSEVGCRLSDVVVPYHEVDRATEQATGFGLLLS
jgi:hypothetical protein